VFGGHSLRRPFPLRINVARTLTSAPGSGLKSIQPHRSASNPRACHSVSGSHFNANASPGLMPESSNRCHNADHRSFLAATRKSALLLSREEPHWPSLVLWYCRVLRRIGC
jgi:hypothetical protein